MIPWVPKKTIDYNRVQNLLSESIEANQFTNGSPIVNQLEIRIRNLLKIDESKSIVCVSNGTVALWAVVAAIEKYHNKDLQFYTQSFTFPASAQGYLDNVIIVDIDDECGIDLSLIDINKCDGIIVTNIFGNIVDISKYEKWGKEYNKFIIFDNAATSNTFYKGKNSCNYGTATTLSFHHTKPIGFGEGGCVIIDRKYERSLRNIMNFGIDNTSLFGRWDRKGGNYKMSDLQAVYIYQYLDNFDKIVKKTTKLYNHFLENTCTLPLIKTLPNFSDGTPFVSCICIIVENSREIIERLLKNNIYCRKYYNPLIDTKNASKLYNKIVCITCNTDMSLEDIDRIVNILKE
jgi:dTDP-4-amino-4,6-dideoxygalactose transaminase